MASTSVESLFEEFKKLPGVEAIALDGSRASDNYDEKSDYDVYVYCKEPVSEEARTAILSKSCQHQPPCNRIYGLLL